MFTQQIVEFLSPACYFQFEEKKNQEVLNHNIFEIFKVQSKMSKVVEELISTQTSLLKWKQIGLNSTQNIPIISFK